MKIDELKQETIEMYIKEVAPFITDGLHENAHAGMERILEKIKAFYTNNNGVGTDETDAMYIGSALVLKLELEKTLPCHLRVLMKQFEDCSKPQQPSTP